MRVNLGGGETGMPEQFLHSAQVCPTVEQVSGSGVPKAVWRQGGLVSEPTGHPTDDITGSALIETAASRPEQKCSTARGGNPTVTAMLYPSLQGLLSGDAVRDGPLLVSLSRDSQDSTLVVDVSEV
jgi:hypothetical protein